MNTEKPKTAGAEIQKKRSIVSKVSIKRAHHPSKAKQPSRAPDGRMAITSNPPSHRHIQPLIIPMRKASLVKIRSSNSNSDHIGRKTEKLSILSSKSPVPSLANLNEFAASPSQLGGSRKVLKIEEVVDEVLQNLVFEWIDGKGKFELIKVSEVSGGDLQNLRKVVKWMEKESGVKKDSMLLLGAYFLLIVLIGFFISVLLILNNKSKEGGIVIIVTSLLTYFFFIGRVFYRGNQVSRIEKWLSNNSELLTNRLAKIGAGYQIIHSFHLGEEDLQNSNKKQRKCCNKKYLVGRLEFIGLTPSESNRLLIESKPALNTSNNNQNTKETMKTNKEGKPKPGRDRRHKTVISNNSAQNQQCRLGVPPRSNTFGNQKPRLVIPSQIVQNAQFHLEAELVEKTERFSRKEGSSLKKSKRSSSIVKGTLDRFEELGSRQRQSNTFSSISLEKRPIYGVQISLGNSDDIQKSVRGKKCSEILGLGMEKKGLSFDKKVMAKSAYVVRESEERRMSKEKSFEIQVLDLNS